MIARKVNCVVTPDELLPWQGTQWTFKYNSLYDEYDFHVSDPSFVNSWIRVVLVLGKDGRLTAPIPGKGKIPPHILRPRLNGHRFLVDHVGDCLVVHLRGNFI